PYPASLPDFRNLGVIARVLVAVNAIALGGALFAAPDLAQAIDRFAQIAALVEPLLLACLVVLFVLSPLLARLPYWTGCAAVMALVRWCCCRRWCCSRCSRTPSTTASSPAQAPAKCWCASSGAAIACSRASRILTSKSSSTAPATAW